MPQNELELDRERHNAQNRSQTGAGRAQGSGTHDVCVRASDPDPMHTKKKRVHVVNKSTLERSFVHIFFPDSTQEMILLPAEEFCLFTNP